ncbi:MAG TPA: hypothetical protein VK363_03365 [Pyrinomonadaceae bacterium]|nr:hypothetical protein [Pyrinomonadaceae bacterium]
MERRVTDPSQIKGWGVDSDTENDPTYPMKNRNNGEHAGYSWERPSQQPESVEILHSNERPHVTAAFGTSTPPAGLSGMIRRYAFKYSESSYGHWLPLMLADRVGVVEGYLEDFSRGHIPNVFAERGWKAEWKHNRRSLVTRVVVGAVIASAAVAYLRSGKDDSPPQNRRRPRRPGAKPRTLDKVTNSVT